MSGHYIDKCMHGLVKAQCRCMNHEKVVRRVPCDDACVGAQMYSSPQPESNEPGFVVPMGGNPDFVPNPRSDRFDLMLKIGERVGHAVNVAFGKNVTTPVELNDELREIAHQATDEIDVLLGPTADAGPPTLASVQASLGESLIGIEPKEATARCRQCKMGECGLCRGRGCKCAHHDAPLVPKTHGFHSMVSIREGGMPDQQPSGRVFVPGDEVQFDVGGQLINIGVTRDFKVYVTHTQSQQLNGGGS